MRVIISFLLAVFGLVPAEAQWGYAPVVVAGRITGAGESRAVSIIVDDLITGNQLTFAALADSCGEFRIEGELFDPREIYLSYDDRMALMYMAPGDSIYVVIDAARFPDGGMEFSGMKAEMNCQINRFFREFVGGHGYEDIVRKIDSLSPMQYRDKVLAELWHSGRFYDDYRSRNTVAEESDAFIRAFLKYWCACDLAQIVFHTDSQPDEYWDNEKIFSVNDTAAVGINNWNYYVGLLTGRRFRDGTPAMKEAVDAYDREDYFGYVDRAARYTLDNYTGIVKDVTLSQLFAGILDDDPEAFGRALEQYEDCFDRPEIVGGLRSRADRLAADIEIEGTALENRYEGADFLTELIRTNYPGKVVYIDLWATWCAPCLSQMPHSRELHSAYEGQEVVFLYLCDNVQEQAWRSKIEQLGITGQHMLLTEDQYAILRAGYGVQGFPTYMIADRSGRIVEANAPRPDDKRVRVLLDRYLGESL